jgi:hypothetical protein
MTAGGRASDASRTGWGIAAVDVTGSGGRYAIMAAPSGPAPAHDGAAADRWTGGGVGAIVPKLPSIRDLLSVVVEVLFDLGWPAWKRLGPACSNLESIVAPTYLVDHSPRRVGGNHGDHPCLSGARATG